MSGVLELTRLLVASPGEAMQELVESPIDGAPLLLFVWGVTGQAVALAVVSSGFPMGGPAALLGALLGASLILLLGGAALHFSAGLLGGEGSSLDLLRTLALVMFPNAVLPAFAFAGEGLFTWARLAVALWQIVLLVLAVREVYRFTTGAAVVALLAPVLLVVGVLPLAAMLILGLGLMHMF